MVSVISQEWFGAIALVSSDKFACSVCFGPCVSVHNEDIFVHLKSIHSTFIY